VAPLAAAVFDTAVNMGVSRAIRFLREAKTQSEHSGVSAWQIILVLRQSRYDHLINTYPEKVKFYKGWSNRVKALKDFCRELAKEEDEEVPSLP
jgi:hypothetical protein